MIKEENDIKILDRIKELVIDWLVISIYLIILAIISISFYMIVFKGIPKVTELQSQLIATVTSVIPIIIIFSILDFKSGSIGKQKLGLKLYFKEKKFKYSIIRNVLKFLPWQIGHMATIHGIYTEFDTISIILQIIALTLLVTMFLMGILRKDKRHLGDIIAEKYNCPKPDLGKSVEIFVEGRRLNFYRLPSTSRAYPLPLEKKAEYYRKMYQETGLL